MKRTLKIAVLGAALAAFMLPAMGQSAPTTAVPAPTASTQSTPSTQGNVINQRRENQQDRVAQGVNTGQLTPRESANIQNREAAINSEIRADRQANGGKMTAAERAKVHNQLNRTSQKIYKDKHNSAQQPH
jgi:hypothetical protein